MTVNDPLLKKLKDCLLEISRTEEVVTDEHLFLQPLCQTLEEIFRKGLKDDGFFLISRSDYWDWISHIPKGLVHERASGQLFRLVERVTSCPKTTTSQGRGRLFIRYALVNQAILWPLNLLWKYEKAVLSRYDPLFSIVGNDILAEILQSLLTTLCKIDFQLDLKNTSFLDETWTLPVYKHYELVPCLDIGIRVFHWQGRALIIEVVPDSVAAEDDKIQPGDILDDLLSNNLKGVKKGQIGTFLKQNTGLPVRISVVKGLMASGYPFPPIVDLIRSAGFDPLTLIPHQSKAISSKSFKSTNSSGSTSDQSETDKPPPHAQLPDDEFDEVPVHGQDAAFYRISFLGTVPTGQTGGMDRIETAIADAISAENTRKPVTLELGEKDVVIRDATTKELRDLIEHIGLSKLVQRSTS